MSIFFPQWMKPNPFYPTWMGNVEIDVEIVVPDLGTGGSGYVFNEYSSSEILSLYVHSIIIQQCTSNLDIDIQHVNKYISNIQIPKLKFIPKINTIKVKFNGN